MQVSTPESEMEGSPYQRIYCPPCEIWLRDEAQYLKHVDGKRHRAELRRTSHTAQAIPTASHTSIREGAAAAASQGDGKHQTDAENDDSPRWCSDCQVWLRNEPQYADHIAGKRHRRRRQRAALMAEAAAAALNGSTAAGGVGARL